MIIQGVTLVGDRVVDGSIIMQNLAIWIDANNSSSYPGTGTTITDLSGNGRTQNLASSAQYTVLNGVKCFDCNSNSISAASAVPTLPTTGFTYISWARMKSSTADWRTLFRCSPNDHPLLIELGSNRLGMYDNTANAFYPCGYTVDGLADAWVQWAVTGDSTGQTFYINGQQVGTVSGQTAAGNNHYYTGGITTSQNFGYVANMFLYTAMLTPEQIQQNYYNQRRNFGILSYTTVGSTTWVAPPDITSVNYLVVGGGGGGGQAADNAGAGGGGAGMVLTGNIAVTAGTSYTITIGDGGTGGNSGSNIGAQNGNTGNSSVFSTITALGGGGGFASRASQALVGNAQVGNTTAATGGGGGPGGGGGNGGGGAVGAGVAHSGTSGGAGGTGTSSSITGTSVTYGAGASGGSSGSQNGGAAGTSNTGNGGQGGGATSANFRAGGKGGSGIVVLRYNQE